MTEVVQFAHYCKCKHCGYEWTETKVVRAKGESILSLQDYESGSALLD
jgi:hypothetical protein